MLGGDVLPFQHATKDLGRIGPGEREGADHRLVEQDADGEDVNTLVDVPPFDLLRGHVRRASEDLPSRSNPLCSLNFRNAEVHEFYRSAPLHRRIGAINAWVQRRAARCGAQRRSRADRPLGKWARRLSRRLRQGICWRSRTDGPRFEGARCGNHDVFRLHVSVDDACLVGVLEGGKDFDRKRPRDLRRHSPVVGKERPERGAANELDGEPALIFVLVGDVVDLQNVPVAKFRNRPCFHKKTRSNFRGVAEMRMEHLHRDVPLEARIVGPVDRRHTAVAELFADVVLAEAGERAAPSPTARRRPALRFGAAPRRENRVAGVAAKRTQLPVCRHAGKDTEGAPQAGIIPLGK